MNKRNNIWHYLHQFKFNSLFLRNLALILILMVVPITVIIFLSYSELEAERNSRIMMINEELLAKNVVVTENILGEIISLMEDVAEEPLVLHALVGDDVSLQNTSKADWAFQTIDEKLKGNPYISSAFLYSEENGLILDVRQRSIHDALLYPNKEKWYYLHQKYNMKVPYALINAQNNLLFCKPVLDGQGRSFALIVFEVSIMRIQDLLEREGVTQNGCLLMMDIAGNVLYASHSRFGAMSKNEKQALLKQVSQIGDGETVLIKNSVSKFVSITKSDYQSWKYALVMELPEYENEIGQTRDFVFTVFGIGLAIAGLTAYIITLITYRPIKKIIEVMDKPESYRENQKNNASSEIAYITANILKTIKSYDAINSELQDRIQKAREYQAYALQFQINPHFLYNTLETIRWSVIEDTHVLSRSTELISKVAKLYRIGLETDNVLLPLSEEITFLQLYVDILKARYRQKITFVWEINESLNNCMVIKLCIQPLIENAVGHGLKPKGYRGTIKIAAYCERKRLCIAVENNGEGMTSGQIVALNRVLQSREVFSDGQVGLRNVNERIKLLFGDEYGLSLSQVIIDGKNCGTRVVVTFPYAEAQSERGNKT